MPGDRGYVLGHYFTGTDVPAGPDDAGEQPYVGFFPNEPPVTRGAIARVGARLSLAIVGGFALLILIAALS